MAARSSARRAPNPYKSDDGIARVRTTLAEENIDALIAIGGEDTLGVAHRLAEDGIRVVGVPKTIDNDLSATELTFGFDTAVQTAMDAIDRLHTTAESHDRVMVVEVMGRHAGWIALHSGIAGGANVILIPERPFDIAAVCEHLQHRSRRGENASIVVVAEGAVPAEGTMTLQSGAVDDFGHVRLGGVGNQLTDEIKSRTGFDTRATILGHVLRGGTPTAFDRVLADALRHRRHRRGARRRHRRDGGAAGGSDRAGAARRRGRHAQDRRPRRSTSSPRPSSADRAAREPRWPRRVPYPARP